MLNDLVSAVCHTATQFRALKYHVSGLQELILEASFVDAFGMVRKPQLASALVCSTLFQALAPLDVLAANVATLVIAAVATSEKRLINTLCSTNKDVVVDESEVLGQCGSIHCVHDIKIRIGRDLYAGGCRRVGQWRGVFGGVCFRVTWRCFDWYDYRNV